MARPELYHVDAARKLKGDAYVTYPGNDLTVRRIERVATYDRGKTFAYLIPDAEYTSAVLVDQHITGGDHNRVEIYLGFEEFPGPWIPFTRYDDTLGPIQGRQRAVLAAAGQVATLTATTKTTYQSRGGSKLVSIQLEESSSDGTGIPDVGTNPLFPITGRDFYDEKRGSVHETKQAVIATGLEVASIAESGGTVMHIDYEDIDQFKKRKITQTWTVPGPERITKDMDDETGARIRIVRQTVLNSTTPIAIADPRTFDTISMHCDDSKIEQENSLWGDMISVFWETPPSRTELSSEKAICPAIFNAITGWTIPPTLNTSGPYAGVSFSLTAKRTSVGVSQAFSYTLGASGVALPALWNVVSPGAASRLFPISGDTIHNAIAIYEDATLIENLPASTPSSYTPGSTTMILRASEKPFAKARIFNEKIISTGTEAT